MHLLLPLFCIGLSSLFAISQLTSKPQSTHILAAGFFGSASASMGYLLLFSERGLDRFPILFMGYVPATIIGAVSIFLFFKTYLEDRELDVSDSIHSIPIIISVVIFLVFVSINPHQKMGWIHDLYGGRHFEIFIPFTLLSVGTATIYLIKTMRLNPDYYSFDFKKRPSFTGGMILISIGVGALLGMATIHVPFAIMLTKHFLTGCSLIFITGTAIHFRNPAYFATWITEFKKNYQKRNYLSEIDIDNTHSKLLRLMTSDQIYKDNELTLEKLAGLLSISKYQLSQLLNVEIKTSFSRFIQSYRVRTAQDYLDTQPNRTILSIAYEVGFNSNSSFQSAFKTLVGMTPSEYRARRK